MHEQLEEILGIHFHNPQILTLALTHRSFIYETSGLGQNSNERLEFLGDSILALISADFLYRTYPELAEGELTDARAVLVRTETLAQFAREILPRITQHLRGAERLSQPAPLPVARALPPHPTRKS